MAPDLNSRDPNPKRHQSEPPGMSNKVSRKDSCEVAIVQEKRPEKSTSKCSLMLFCFLVGVILAVAVDGGAGYGHLAGEAATKACSKIGITSAPLAESASENTTETSDKDGDQGHSEEWEKATKELIGKWEKVTEDLIDRIYGSRAALCGIFCYLVKTIGKPAEPEIKEESTQEEDAEAEGEDTTGKLSTASYDAAAECHEARKRARRIWCNLAICVKLLLAFAYGIAYGPIFVLVLLASILTGAFAFGIIYAILKAIYRFIIN